jgi:diadenosine tetraphosphatase ApaH/serine/threonine PP2A family protein phosphatase
MRALAFDLRFELAEQRVGLVHGSPRKVNEYLFQDKPARASERIAAGADCDVLVFGHTHKPWTHSYGGVMFVNGGSVGKPKDGDPRAEFGVLEREDAGRVGASIERVPYDAHTVAREVAAAGLPGEYAQKLVAAAERKARMSLLYVTCSRTSPRSEADSGTPRPRSSTSSRTAMRSGLISRTRTRWEGQPAALALLGAQTEPAIAPGRALLRPGDGGDQPGSAGDGRPDQLRL